VANAELYLRSKLTDDERNIREIVIWKVERSTNTPDGVRYRLAFIPAGERRPRVLYDNHPPKGHHRHIVGTQSAYRFEMVTKLLRDFEASIKEYLERH
jgi:Family of unknown function (DUF6516)